MQMKLGLTLAAVGLVASAAVAVAAPRSGLAPGQPMGIFDVVDVTGSDKGRQLCFI